MLDSVALQPIPMTVKNTTRLLAIIEISCQIVAKFENQMPRDFTSNNFKFSPDAINALVKYCRETAINGRWRDDDQRSRGLWVYVGARGATY